MELNITKFFTESAPADYSASRMELGENAGRITWNAALHDSECNADLLDTEEKRDAFRAHVRDFGAWDDSEIAAWSNAELTALLMQMIAGDMREVPDVDMGPDMTDDDWRTYEELAEQGTIAGNMFRGDDGQVYYYIGS